MVLDTDKPTYSIQLFQIYDSVAHTFLDAIIPAKTIVDMIRHWTDVVNDPKSPYYSNPGDYSLFHWGTFYPQTGDVEILSVKNCLGTALQYQKSTQVSAPDNKFWLSDDIYSSLKSYYEETRSFSVLVDIINDIVRDLKAKKEKDNG